jgi:hypothetical protein
MNRYWDLSEKDRSELESADVEAMLAVELMEKGVKKVDPPKLLAVEFPVIPKKTVWIIKRENYSWSQSDVAYETAEAAALGIQGAIWIESAYIGGESSYSIDRTPLKVESLQVAEAADVCAAKSLTEKAAANKKANDAALKDFEAASKCVNEAVEGVWDDWHECRAKAHRYQQVIDTRAEYRAICEGDMVLADKFLLKAYSRDEANAATAWFGETGVCTVEEVEELAEAL